MTGPGAAIEMRVGGLTDVGRVRKHNEDNIALLTPQGIWVVADGMGGHAAGDVASAIIVEEMESLGMPVSAQDQRSRMLERLDRAHLRILAHAQANGLSTVGATVAALLIFEAELTCVWAGDSRIYLWRQGKLTQLTQDHSEVAQLVAAGQMTEAEARTAARRNVITRAIGIGPKADPQLVSGVAQPCDRFLVCSDGLTEHMDDHDIAALLANPAPPNDIASALIRETLERGAKDNVSVIIVDCEPAAEGDEAAD